MQRGKSEKSQVQRLLISSTTKVNSDIAGLILSVSTHDEAEGADAEGVEGEAEGVDAEAEGVDVETGGADAEAKGVDVEAEGADAEAGGVDVKAEGTDAEAVEAEGVNMEHTSSSTSQNSLTLSKSTGSGGTGRLLLVKNVSSFAVLFTTSVNFFFFSSATFLYCHPLSRLRPSICTAACYSINDIGSKGLTVKKRISV
uniref:Uncharacterized protein LOC114335507 n=1 Tax=Diabrotica virgifera virgifera TaxID=50390 RepID=A0A6P7GAW4_DIAVI